MVTQLDAEEEPGEKYIMHAKSVDSRSGWPRIRNMRIVRSANAELRIAITLASPTSVGNRNG